MFFHYLPIYESSMYGSKPIYGHLILNISHKGHFEQKFTRYSLVPDTAKSIGGMVKQNL